MGEGADGDIKKKQWNRQAEYEWAALWCVSVRVGGCRSCPRVAGGAGTRARIGREHITHTLRLIIGYLSADKRKQQQQ